MCHRIFKFRPASSCRRLSVVRRGGRLGIWIQSCKYFVNINMSYEKQQKRLEELWQEILSEEETEVSAFEVDATSDEYEPETSSEDSSSECSSKKKARGQRLPRISYCLPKLVSLQVFILLLLNKQ